MISIIISHDSTTNTTPLTTVSIAKRLEQETCKRVCNYTIKAIDPSPTNVRKTANLLIVLMLLKHKSEY